MCTVSHRISPDWRTAREFALSLCVNRHVTRALPTVLRGVQIEFGSEQPLANQTPLGRRGRLQNLTLITAREQN
jgi:hypothetical protein